MNIKLHKENPCYKCEDRSAICHSICERYKTWSDKVVKQRENRYNQKQAKSRTYPSSMDNLRKNR